MKEKHIAARAAGGTNYYFADKLAEIRQRVAAGHDVINLGIGSPDLSPDALVLDAIDNDMPVAGAFGYQPYRGVPELSAAFTRYLDQQFNVQIGSADCVPLLGSKEACGFLSLAHLDPGDVALVPDPGYPTYAASTRLAGGVPVPYPLSAASAYHPDVATLEAIVSSLKQEGRAARMMWMNYPNMPTGAAPDRLRLQDVVDWASGHGILVVHDNPYARILNDGPPFSILSLDGGMAHCIELHSLSKSHRMAGARVGFAVGSQNLLAPMFKVATQFASGSWRPLQFAAIQALDHGEPGIAEANALYRDRKAAGLRLLSALDCNVQPNQQGMFLWARVPGGQHGNALSDALLEACDVFLTPGSVFGSEGSHHVRLSLCTPAPRIEEATQRIQTKFHST